MSIKLNFALAVSLSLLLAQKAFSQPLPYPVVPDSNADDLICYMQNNQRQTLDLGKLCGQVSASPVINTSPVNYTNSPIPSSSSLSTPTGGNCQYEWQLDRNSNRCGGRASNRRSGGQ